MNARIGNLGGKPPLGLKVEKAIKRACRKAVRRMSKKREAYLASPERQDGLAHMARVAQLPCLVCRGWPVEVHHLPDPRSDLRVIPLCQRHHKREYGEGSFHYSPKAFYALHGDSRMLLAKVADMLAGEFNFGKGATD